MRVNFGSTAPIIDIATGKRMEETRLNGAHGAKPSVDHRSAASPPPAGHNSGVTAADVAAKENLRRGLYRSQRDALIAVARDPRCTKRHSLVHAIVVGFMNADTGMAFPGWRTIAEKAAIFPGNVPDPAGAYDESTIYNLLSDLRRWGYLLSVKRGPQGGGRAIAHYGIAEPPYEKLQEEITKFIMKDRARAREDRERLDALAARQPDLTTPSEDKSGSDLTRVREDGSDLTRGRASDLTRGRATVTRIEEPEETPANAEAPHTSLLPDGSSAPSDGSSASKKNEVRTDARTAFGLYVAMAQRCGLPVPRSADAWLTKIGMRVKQAGGLDVWKEMLAIVENTSFLQGDNQTGWKANLPWLVKAENFDKVLSGQYANRARPKVSPSGGVF